MFHVISQSWSTCSRILRRDQITPRYQQEFRNGKGVDWTESPSAARAKRVAQAFFDQLATLAEDKQAEVGKAASSMVRETLMTRREKAKAYKSKLRNTKTTPAKGKRAAATERKTRGPARARKPRSASDTQDSDQIAGEK